MPSVNISPAKGNSMVEGIGPRLPDSNQNPKFISNFDSNDVKKRLEEYLNRVLDPSQEVPGMQGVYRPQKPAENKGEPLR